MKTAKPIVLDRGTLPSAVDTVIAWMSSAKLPDPRFVLAFGIDKKRDLTQIQWFVAIACSYLLLVQDDQIVRDPIHLLPLVVTLALMLVFLRLPYSVFTHRLFPQIMAVVDTVLISTAIVFNRQSPWDLFLVFFFGILIAAIGENLVQSIAVSLVVGILLVVIIPLSDKGALQMDSQTLLRVPLLFGASLVYGYLADQVKRERKNAAQLEELRRHQLLIKDQFFSHVSHELRTPLTVIYQFVTILSDGLAGDLSAEQRDYLEIVLRNVKQLQSMVGDLLESARAESGKLAVHRQVVSLRELGSETLLTLLPRATVKAVALTADIPSDLPFVYADPQRVKQILTNLVDNAIKFTPAGGKITVRAQSHIEDQSLVRVSVADTGCGISPEGTEKIFDRLYQEKNLLETNRKGLGLGLHICNELVSRHGGRVWVESQLGKGSTFHFTLPVFSLGRLLASLFKVDRCRGPLALIAIQISPQESALVSDLEKLSAEPWSLLKNFVLPDKAALLPRMPIAAERGLYFAVSAGDLDTTRGLAARIQREIGNCKRVQDGKCRIDVSVMNIEAASTGPGAELNDGTEELWRAIRRLIGDAEAKWNKADTDLSGAITRDVERELRASAPNPDL
jgi:signal transduction histidine kinase